MNIKFKDGHEIEFKKIGEIWLAESVIWEETELHGSLDELRILKAKIAHWFEENAPEEIREEYNARLPFWGEIKALPFKDQVAYMEGRTNRIVDYFLGDEDNDSPIASCMHIDEDDRGRFYCFSNYDWSDKFAVRLCLEKKK